MKQKMNYCTLFGANYLDKGIVMIKSLLRFESTSVIYVLAMDDRCYEILKDYALASTVVISLNEFEDDNLRTLKESRGFGEYCWTCTASLIQYAINKYDLSACTYVDADLYFFSDPVVMYHEMRNNNCTVQTTRHGFTDTLFGRYYKKKFGINCVQFITFTNSVNSLSLLDKWKKECIDECALETGGDQRYTDAWSELNFVNVSENAGSGVAPWNINRFRLKSKKHNTIYDVDERKEYQLIFYHFQNVVNVSRNCVRVNVLLEHLRIDPKLFNYIYRGYLFKLEKQKTIIENRYNYTPIIVSYISDSNSGSQEHEERFRKILKKIISFVNKNGYEKILSINLMVLKIVRRNKIYFNIK